MNPGNNKVWVAAVVGVLVGGLLGYVFCAKWGGGKIGETVRAAAYEEGYQKAIADTRATQEEVARKAVEEAAKAANPFQTQNPLEGITANPFEDAARKLNPFAQ